MAAAKAPQEYAIGLDLGNGSVGFVAMTPQYRLMRAKGKEIIGARLFEPAETAENRRMFRTTRRRLSRRKWRLRLLNAQFASELAKIDPNFLARRKYSWVHPEDSSNTDHQYGGIIFDSLAEDKAFYRKYSTMYHLRKELMEHDLDPETGKPFDIRKIYLAIHHAIKFRGNFLWSGTFNAESSFDVHQLVNTLCKILELSHRGEDDAVAITVDEAALRDALVNAHLSRSARSEQALKAIHNHTKKQEPILQNILKSLVGNQGDFSKVFDSSDMDADTKKKLKLNFSNAEIETQLAEAQSILDEESSSLLAELYQTYDAITLLQLLGESTTISDAMIRKYAQHKENWSLVKEELRNADNSDEVNSNYLKLTNQWLKLSPIPEMGKRETERKNAKTFFIKLIEESNLANKQSLLDALKDDNLFPLQRTSDNGVIPHQLHLNELHAIIERQGKHYPFLKETIEIDDGMGGCKEANKIESLLKFRIPYYVGPLVSPNAMQSSDNSQNHWMVRKRGDEKRAITPWNMGEVVDYDASARNFMDRLTGTDTYLIGEPTLPKNSLTYQEYEVLSELNNCRVVASNPARPSRKQSPRRLSFAEKMYLIDTLFKKRITVKVQKAQDALHQQFGDTYLIQSLSDPKQFNSSLSSYVTLSNIFGEDYVNRNRSLMEKIIELQTVFEDKRMLTHQLRLLGSLEEATIEKLAKKHYTGWGRFSKMFLTKPFATAKLGKNNDVMPVKHSILDIMQYDDLNLMEILSDKDNGAQKWINEFNNDHDQDISTQELTNDLYVSPKVKRGIKQTINVIDDIIKAVGHEPAHIFIETADDIEESQQTQSKKDRLTALYKNANLGSDFKDIQESLASTNNHDLNDRLYLYYLQLGKDMYTGEELVLDRLSSAYDIDHIAPQSRTQDDSFDNRVLVSRKENARKSNSLLYTTDVITKMRDHWNRLKESGLMSERKYRALTRTSEMNDKEKERFVARSLVDTRQIIKNVSTILRQRYGSSARVTGMNSSITHDMRRYLGFAHKNRDINDYHHAQDALCITAAGYFMTNRGIFAGGERTTDSFNGLQVNAFNTYLQTYIAKYRKSLDGNSNSQPFGFVVGSMRSSREEMRTNPLSGEIVWSEKDADYLRKVMNFKKMLITYKSGDDIGALYKETRLPHTSAKVSVPLRKEQQNTALYGGFTGQQNACAVLLADKKGKAIMLDIPMRLYAQYLQCRDNDKQLLELLKTVDAKKVAGATVLLNHVPKNQLMTYRSNKVLVKSASELNNAQQLWLDHKNYDLVDKFVEAKMDLEGSEILQIFNALMQALQRYYPLYSVSNEKLVNAHQKFSKLDVADQQAIISGLLTALHAGAGRTDELKKIGFTGAFGRYNQRPSIRPEDTDEIIMQSPSGLFEKHITIAQLKKRAGIA